MQTLRYAVPALVLFALASPLQSHKQSATGAERAADQDRIEAEHARAMAACDDLAEAADERNLVGQADTQASVELAQQAFHGRSDPRAACVEEADAARAAAEARLAARP